jgi:uncharacterized membrane protein
MSELLAVSLTFIFFIGLLVLWIWALVKVLQKSDEAGYHTGNQLIWILLLIFLGPVGAALYYFLEHRQS